MPSSPSARTTTQPRWVAGVDLLGEVLLAGFAVYTVVHLVAAEAGWSVRTAGVLWLFLGLPTMAGLAWWGHRSSTDAPAALTPGRTPRGQTTGFVALAALAALGCARLTGHAFLLPWALALVLAGVSVVTWWRSPGSAHPPRPTQEAPAPVDDDRPAPWAHLAVLLLAVGLGVFVLFVLNPSRDDVYYVNRATWVAEHGTFPDRDTMFGPQTFPGTYGTGLPVAALEEAYGSLARLFGVPAASLAYLVANPVFVSLSVWSTWRLVRSWAARRHLAALVVAVAVPLLTGTGLLGEFGFAREWQGKVVVILLVMPLVWVHLTRLARGAPPAWSAVVLGILGVAWCGLTITAPIFAGLLAGIGILGAVLLPDVRRPLGLGALALLAGPLLTGMATVLTSKGPVAEENFISEPSLAWVKVLGDDRVPVVLLGLALLVGPLLVADRAGRLVAALASAVTLAVLAPGVFDLLDAATGSGPIAVRMLFTAPFPVLVGLLVTAPLVASPAARLSSRSTALLPGLVAGGLVVALLAATGTSVWSRGSRASLVSSPTWKITAEDRARAEAVVAEDPGPGPVLLPPAESRALAVTTTRVFAVVPRDFYLQFLHEPRAQREARYALRRFIDPTRRDPRPPALAVALQTLDVSLVCVPGRARGQQDELRRIGLSGRHRLAGMVCFDGVTPPAGRAPAR